MGIGSRIGLVFSNLAMLIPVFILLIASAIMSSIGAAKIASLNDQDAVANAHKYVTMSTVLLWIIFAGGFVFSFTIGLFIIPYLITIPYLYGGIMIMFALLNFVIAGILFYAANAVRGSKDYQDGTDDAKSAFNNCLITGIMMVIAAIFMIGYALFSIHKYRKAGGLRGDIAVGAEIGAVLQPEFAPVLGVVGAAAREGLTESQQAEQAKRASGAKGLIDIGTKVTAATGKGGKGFTSLLTEERAPQLVQTALEMV